MTITEQQLELLLTSMELLEKESKLKGELIITLREQISLLETRNAELPSMIERLSNTEEKG